MMKSRVTLKDIALKLGLSHATVSRSLSGVPDLFISDATRDRVRRAAEEMGYRPNHAARALVTGKTGIIALWLWAEGMQNSYQAQVFRNTYAAIRSRPYQLIINVVGQRTLGIAAEQRPAPWSVDGIISHEAGPAVLALMGEQAAAHLPIVSTGAYNLLPNVDFVGIDLFDGAVDAVRHLVQPGRRRVAYLTDDLPHRAADARYMAYVRTLAEAGLPPEFIGVEDSLRATGRTAMLEYVESKGCPDALFCHNDDLALGAYRALCDLGIRVPDDVALVGCDGTEDTEYLETPISTIVQPLHQMCALACEYLENRMNDHSRARQETWLNAHFEIRASSAV